MRLTKPRQGDPVLKFVARTLRSGPSRSDNGIDFANFVTLRTLSEMSCAE